MIFHTKLLISHTLLMSRLLRGVEVVGLILMLNWIILIADKNEEFRVQQFKMHAGIRTHMDAPAHCIPGSTPH